MKKILFLYAAPESGHAQAAQALAQAASQKTNWAIRQDYITRHTPGLEALFLGLYKSALTWTPGLWGRLHNNPSYEPLARPMERLLGRWDFFGVLKAVGEYCPDAVVLTHALPLRILSAARAAGDPFLTGRASPGAVLRGAVGHPLPRLFAVTTDFWAHRYWASKFVDHYFASCSQTAGDLMERGVQADKILVTGIPLRGEFADCRFSKVELRRGLGLDPSRFTVLVLGGSYGLFPFGEFLDLAQGPANPWQWIFVFGRNAEALRQSKRRASDSVLLFGFRDDMARLMAASDILITKAGALSASEALATGLPMILCSPLPGQEEGNARYLTDLGAALRADQPRQAVERVRELFLSPAKLLNMMKSAKAASRPQAALQIIEEIGNQVDRMGIEPTTSSLRTRRSPS